MQKVLYIDEKIGIMTSLVICRVCMEIRSLSDVSCDVRTEAYAVTGSHRRDSEDQHRWMWQ